MTRSTLDDVPGLGPSRQAALLRAFGSVKKIRAAGVADLVAVPGIGPALAQVILDTLGTPGAPAEMCIRDRHTPKRRNPACDRARR